MLTPTFPATIHEDTMMRTASLLALAALCAAAIVPTANAAERVVKRGAATTANGGVVAGKAVGYQGPNGAAGVRGHAMATDGNGNARTVSGAAGTTANGGRYGRTGTTDVGANGAVSHRSGSAVQGPNGSASSAGGFTRNPDGTYSGQRSTHAQGASGGNYSGNTTYANGSGAHTTNATAKNGDTYSGQTDWTKGQGATHSGTCRDAAGNVIPCR